MARGDLVPRPRRKNEYEIVFGSKAAQTGWADLLATKRNALADSWDFLASNPTEISTKCYPLRGELAWITKGGVSHQRWQLKLDLNSGSRIWYFVSGNQVVLEQVHTSHPNQTK